MSALLILIADDDPVAVEFARAHLRDANTVVIAARDGAEALYLARSQKPDAMLLDLQMPEMDGFDVLKRVRADPEISDMPVIVVTSRRDEFAVNLARESGATFFFTKPLDWPLMQQQLRFFVRRSGQGAVEERPKSGLAA